MRYSVEKAMQGRSVCTKLENKHASVFRNSVYWRTFGFRRAWAKNSGKIWISFPPTIFNWQLVIEIDEGQTLDASGLRTIDLASLGTEPRYTPFKRDQ